MSVVLSLFLMVIAMAPETLFNIAYFLCYVGHGFNVVTRVTNNVLA